jgi:hypothetical protein
MTEFPNSKCHIGSRSEQIVARCVLSNCATYDSIYPRLPLAAPYFAARNTTFSLSTLRCCCCRHTRVVPKFRAKPPFLPAAAAALLTEFHPLAVAIFRQLYAAAPPLKQNHAHWQDSVSCRCFAFVAVAAVSNVRGGGKRCGLKMGAVTVLDIVRLYEN